MSAEDRRITEEIQAFIQGLIAKGFSADQAEARLIQLIKVERDRFAKILRSSFRVVRKARSD